MVNDRISFRSIAGLSLAMPAPPPWPKGVRGGDRPAGGGRQSCDGGHAPSNTKTEQGWEARWILEAGQLRFGYVRHTVTDPSGTILAEETTTANERNTRHFKGLLRQAARRKRLSSHEQQLNAGMSWTRYRIELTFRTIRQWFHEGTAHTARHRCHRPQPVPRPRAYCNQCLKNERET